MAMVLALGRTMSAEEADQYVRGVQERGNAQFQKVVIEHEFTRQMQQGTLSKERLRGFIENWFTFSWEINAATAAAYYQFLPFLKAYPRAHDILADKVGDELMHPGPGGHIKTLYPVGEAVGLSAADLVGAKLIPEARALVDYHVRLYRDGPMAEAFSSGLKEGMVGQWLGIFYTSMDRHYGFTRKSSEYFRMHHEADNEEHDGVISHNEANLIVVQEAIVAGEAFRRPGFDPEYALTTGIELYGIFLDGIFKRFPG